MYGGWYELICDEHKTRQLVRQASWNKPPDKLKHKTSQNVTSRTEPSSPAAAVRSRGFVQEGKGRGMEMGRRLKQNSKPARFTFQNGSKWTTLSWWAGFEIRPICSPRNGPRNGPFRSNRMRPNKFFYTIKSENNFNFPHPDRDQRTPHAGPACQVYLGDWIGWKTHRRPKESQFRERFYQKVNYFCTNVFHTHPSYPPQAISLWIPFSYKFSNQFTDIVRIREYEIESSFPWSLPFLQLFFSFRW